jgi:hypothetical protein
MLDLYPGVKARMRRRFFSINGLGLAANNPNFFAHLAGRLKQDPGMPGLVGMEYRCITTSVAGFVQQLVSCYLPHGYWFYVSGVVPRGKDPKAIDAKLMAKYGIGVSRTSRARRKAAGIANVHYIRHQHRFLLPATHGHNPFFDEEAKNIRDARRVPIRFAGYSISVARGGYRGKRSTDGALVRDDKWRVRVRIDHEWYRGLKAYLIDIAPHRSAAELAVELYHLPFEPYAPVRQQLLNLIRYVNRGRAAANLEPISFDVLRYRRQIVRPFEPALPSEAMRLTAVNSAGD